MLFMKKKRPFTTGICTASIFMFSQESQRMGHWKNSQRERGPAGKIEHQKKLAKAKIERLLSRNSSSIPMLS